MNNLQRGVRPMDRSAHPSIHPLKSEIFSTWLIFLHLYIGDRGDKYQVWRCQVASKDWHIIIIIQIYWHYSHYRNLHITRTGWHGFESRVEVQMRPGLGLSCWILKTNKDLVLYFYSARAWRRSDRISTLSCILVPRQIWPLVIVMTLLLLVICVFSLLPPMVSDFLSS